MLTTAEIRAAAAAKGQLRLADFSDAQTRRVWWVRPDIDLSGIVSATDADTGEEFEADVWTLPLHDGADRRAELRAEFGAA